MRLSSFSINNNNRQQSATVIHTLQIVMLFDFEVDEKRNRIDSAYYEDFVDSN